MKLKIKRIKLKGKTREKAKKRKKKEGVQLRGGNSLFISIFYPKKT
jgi:hypothetical protein